MICHGYEKLLTVLKRIITQFSVGGIQDTTPSAERIMGNRDSYYNVARSLYIIHRVVRSLIIENKITRKLTQSLNKRDISRLWLEFTTAFVDAALCRPFGLQEVARLADASDRLSVLDPISTGASGKRSSGKSAYSIIFASGVDGVPRPECGVHARGMEDTVADAVTMSVLTWPHHIVKVLSSSAYLLY